MSGKQKYDLIFSLGEACSCTRVLRKSILQTYSYPFDWLFGSDFVGRCTILTNNFSRYIDFKDLECLHYNNGDKDNLCDAYKNNYYNIIFNHDFEAGKPLDVSYTNVRNKYDRRINRLLNNIETATTVLAVYIETPTCNHIEVPNEDILKGFDLLKEKFGDKIELLYIKNSKNIKEKIRLNDKVTKITCNYKKYDEKLDNVVQMDVLVNALKGYKLNMPLGHYTIKRTRDFFIKIIPLKSLRQKLRDKYHV